MDEFQHPISSSILHELEDIRSVKEYFESAVEPEDKLVAMVEDKSKLPPNLVVQVEPIRFDPENKSLFPTTAYPGRSTIVSGIEESKKYPSVKVSKDRRVRIDAEDLWPPTYFAHIAVSTVCIKFH